MTQLLWPEISIVSLCLIILLLYHVQLVLVVRRTPLKTSIGLTNHLRRDWVRAVMEGKLDLLAVQTLRNWVMASSFLASAAIVIGLSILSAGFRTDHIAECAHALNILGTKDATMWSIKLMILTVCFFFAFFSFALSIRYYNHASFVINVPTADDPIVTYDAVTHIINRANTHYTLGMRAYYLSVPFTLWLFGPTWMLMGTVILTILLYKLDRTI